MPEDSMPRRDRVRRQTIEDALAIALRQLVEGGAGAISLNAIARELGMTGPALYRYFPNREALLTELVVRAYKDLGEVLWVSVEASEGQDPGQRMRHQASEYRSWALGNPHRYLLLFGTPVPGYHAPVERTLPTAQRMMAAAVALMAAVVPETWAAATDPAGIALERWAVEAGLDPMPGDLVRQLFSGWTRLHGVLSPELEGHFQLGLPDPALLYETEVDSLVREIESAIARF
jgi:AcrR family transcriptional regulator